MFCILIIYKKHIDLLKIINTMIKFEEEWSFEGDLNNKLFEYI